MERIWSLQNPRIREWARLGDRRERLSQGCFLVEGVRLVTEALRSGAPVLQLLADESGMSHMDRLMENRSGIEPLEVTDSLLCKLSDSRTSQGIAAIVRLPKEAQGMEAVESADVVGAPCGRVLCLEQVQDPGNVGTMIRSADACGFSTVLLSMDSADPWQPKAVRASMGSLWHVRVLLSRDPVQWVREAGKRGARTLAAHPRNAVPAWQADMGDGFVLVIGNEANGLSEEMRLAVGQTVMVPMEGMAESLNAASAASMLMYESLRQRKSRFRG